MDQTGPYFSELYLGGGKKAKKMEKRAFQLNRAKDIPAGFRQICITKYVTKNGHR